MGDFASALQSQISSALSGSSSAVAEPPSAPAPSSTPASTPASPTAPTPAETPSTPVAEPTQPTVEDDEEFSWPSDTETQPEQPEATPEATPEAQAQPTPQDDPTNWKPEDIDKMLPQQVIDKLLQTNKGRGIYQSYKAMRELEKPIDQGGLGHRPSIDEIREMAQDSNDLKIMAHEFQNAHANPEYAQNWTRQWFQVGQDGRPTPSAMAVAQQLAGTLDKHSPDLYRAVALPIVRNYIEERYRAAEAEQDPDQRVVMFNVARILEADIYGKARDVPEEVWKNGKPVQQQDPKTTEIDQKLKYIKDFENGQRVAAQNAFNTQLNNSIGTQVNADIRYALKPLEDAYKGADGKPTRAYTALVKEFHNEVRQRVLQNPAQLRNFTIALDRARLSGDPNDRQNAARAWAAAARPVIQQLRKEYLKDALDRKVSESAQRHAVLNEASQKRGSTSIGQPTEKSVVPNLARQPGETNEEWVQRRVASVMNVA